MYVVKDLVPDMTLFYKQYRSVKPYLQRTTPAPDVGSMTFPRLVTRLTHHRAVNIANQRTSARSSMASTNASSVPVAQPLAHPTGGTRKNILGPPSSYSHTDGSPIREMKKWLSVRMR